MTKQERKEDTHKRYKTVFKAVDECLPDISKTIIENSDNKKQLKEKLISIMYESLSKLSSIIIKEAKKSYKSFNSDNTLKIEDLLYKKDGKTLEDRVNTRVDKLWGVNNSLKEFSLASITLLSGMELILSTEACHMMKTIIDSKCNILAVSFEGNDCCDNCNDLYEPDEIYWLADNPERPPFHPDCLCEEIEYEYEDLVEMGFIKE